MLTGIFLVLISLYVFDFFIYKKRLTKFLESEIFQENDEDLILQINKSRDFILVTG
jgi:hypothetical protein